MLLLRRLLRRRRRTWLLPRLKCQDLRLELGEMGSEDGRGVGVPLWLGGVCPAGPGSVAALVPGERDEGVVSPARRAYH